MDEGTKRSSQRSIDHSDSDSEPVFIEKKDLSEFDYEAYTSQSIFHSSLGGGPSKQSENITRKGLSDKTEEAMKKLHARQNAELLNDVISDIEDFLGFDDTTNESFITAEENSNWNENCNRKNVNSKKVSNETVNDITQEETSTNDRLAITDNSLTKGTTDNENTNRIENKVISSQSEYIIDSNRYSISEKTQLNIEVTNICDNLIDKKLYNDNNTTLIDDSTDVDAIINDHDYLSQEKFLEYAQHEKIRKQSQSLADDEALRQIFLLLEENINKNNCKLNEIDIPFQIVLKLTDAIFNSSELNDEIATKLFPQLEAHTKALKHKLSVSCKIITDTTDLKGKDSTDSGLPEIREVTLNMSSRSSCEDKTLSDKAPSDETPAESDISFSLSDCHSEPLEYVGFSLTEPLSPIVEASLENNSEIVSNENSTEQLEFVKNIENFQKLGQLITTQSEYFLNIFKKPSQSILEENKKKLEIFINKIQVDMAKITKTVVENDLIEKKEVSTSPIHFVKPLIEPKSEDKLVQTIEKTLIHPDELSVSSPKSIPQTSEPVPPSEEQEISLPQKIDKSPTTVTTRESPISQPEENSSPDSPTLESLEYDDGTLLLKPLVETNTVLNEQCKMNLLSSFSSSEPSDDEEEEDTGCDMKVRKRKRRRTNLKADEISLEHDRDSINDFELLDNGDEVAMNKDNGSSVEQPDNSDFPMVDCEQSVNDIFNNDYDNIVEKGNKESQKNMPNNENDGLLFDEITEELEIKIEKSVNLENSEILISSFSKNANSSFGYDIPDNLNKIDNDDNEDLTAVEKIKNKSTEICESNSIKTEASALSIIKNSNVSDKHSANCDSYSFPEVKSPSAFMAMEPMDLEESVNKHKDKNTFENEKLLNIDVEENDDNGNESYHESEDYGDNNSVEFHPESFQDSNDSHIKDINDKRNNDDNDVRKDEEESRSHNLTKEKGNRDIIVDFEIIDDKSEQIGKEKSEEDDLANDKNDLEENESSNDSDEDLNLNLEPIVHVETLEGKALEDFYDDLQDKEIDKLVDFSALDRKRYEQKRSEVAETTDVQKSRKIEKKSNKLLDILKEVGITNSSDSSDFDEEEITEEQFLKQHNENLKQRYLHFSTSESEVSENDDDEDDLVKMNAKTKAINSDDSINSNDSEIVDNFLSNMIKKEREESLKVIEDDDILANDNDDSESIKDKDNDEMTDDENDKENSNLANKVKSDLLSKTVTNKLNTLVDVNVEKNNKNEEDKEEHQNISSDVETTDETINDLDKNEAAETDKQNEVICKETSTSTVRAKMSNEEKIIMSDKIFETIDDDEEDKAAIKNIPKVPSQLKLISSDDSDCEILDISMFNKTKTKPTKQMDDIDVLVANKRPRTATNNQVADDCISLSSDSDLDLEELPEEESAGKRRRGIRAMLSEDQLEVETKKAQREETDRVKRLEKKIDMMSQRLIQNLTQTQNMMESEIILDYHTKKNQNISVHPDIVKHLKPHQVDGIKFMYDSAYGSIDTIDKYPGSGCILAHCMGLGKTLQLISLLHTVIRYTELKTKKILVICPKTTVMNWADEIERWLGPIKQKPNLKVFYFPDNSDILQKCNILKEWYMSGENGYARAGCMLMGYEAFRTLVFYHLTKKKRLNITIQEMNTIKKRVDETLLSPGADLIICDEGHIIKNKKSAINMAVSKIKTRRRIILTGTPIQNNLKEYYCMVNFIKPSFLGTEKEFANLYSNPIRIGQHKDSSKSEIKRMKQRSYVLHKKLSKFVQRREAAVLKSFLPEKFEYVLFIPMTLTQEKLYEYFLSNNPLKEMYGGKSLIPDYTSLRKIWTHPKVLENAWQNAVMMKEKKERNRPKVIQDSEDEAPDDVLDNCIGKMSVTNDWWRAHIDPEDLESLLPSNKLRIMFEILKLCEENGEKCLIFSAFVAVLNVVEYFMKKISCKDENSRRLGLDQFRGPWELNRDYYRLDGKTAKSIRHALITKFNDPSNTRTKCFLISAKAGGQGINLIGANRVIILDTSWNPSNDQQNIFRIYRLGQMRKCYIYRLLAMGTMEEKVYSRSVTKQAMSFRVVDEQQIDRHYNMAELAELYTLTKTDYSQRPVPIRPVDGLLANLLHNHPNLVYKYHEHDSLLENKPEQDLSEEDKAEAWAAYEKDVSTQRNGGLDMFGNPGLMVGGFGMPNPNLPLGFGGIGGRQFGPNFGILNSPSLGQQLSLLNQLSYPAGLGLSQDPSLMMMSQLYQNSAISSSMVNYGGMSSPNTSGPINLNSSSGSSYGTGSPNNTLSSLYGASALAAQNGYYGSSPLYPQNPNLSSNTALPSMNTLNTFSSLANYGLLSGTNPIPASTGSLTSSLNLPSMSLANTTPTGTTASPMNSTLQRLDRSMWNLLNSNSSLGPSSSTSSPPMPMKNYYNQSPKSTTGSPLATNLPNSPLPTNLSNSKTPTINSNNSLPLNNQPRYPTMSKDAINTAIVQNVSTPKSTITNTQSQQQQQQKQQQQPHQPQQLQQQPQQPQQSQQQSKSQQQKVQQHPQLIPSIPTSVITKTTSSGGPHKSDNVTRTANFSTERNSPQPHVIVKASASTTSTTSTSATNPKSSVVKNINMGIVYPTSGTKTSLPSLSNLSPASVTKVYSNNNNNNNGNNSVVLPPLIPSSVNIGAQRQPNVQRSPPALTSLISPKTTTASINATYNLPNRQNVSIISLNNKGQPSSIISTKTATPTTTSEGQILRKIITKTVTSAPQTTPVKLQSPSNLISNLYGVTIKPTTTTNSVNAKTNTFMSKTVKTAPTNSVSMMPVTVASGAATVNRSSDATKQQQLLSSNQLKNNKNLTIRHTVATPTVQTPVETNRRVVKQFAAAKSAGNRSIPLPTRQLPSLQQGNRAAISKGGIIINQTGKVIPLGNTTNKTAVAVNRSPIAKSGSSSSIGSASIQNTILKTDLNLRAGQKRKANTSIIELVSPSDSISITQIKKSTSNPLTANQVTPQAIKRSLQHVNAVDGLTVVRRNVGSSQRKETEIVELD